MKTSSAILGATMCALTLSGCAERLDYNSSQFKDSNRANEYAVAWVKTIGKIPPDQDWCMLRAVSADIRTAAMGEDVTTRVYSADPESGGNVLAVAQHDGSLRFDISKGIDRVYGEVIDIDGNILAAGMYDISDDRVCIDGSANDGVEPASRYAHDETNGGSWFNAMIACEDLGSAALSDFDFNDIVFGLRRVAGTNTLQITPMAAGGTLSATISITVGDERHEIGDSHDLIMPGHSGEMLNTENPFPQPGATVTIEVPEYWTIVDAWTNQKFSITIDSEGEAYDILSPVPGSAPKMILLDGDWYWPVENMSIYTAYVGFRAWAQGSGDITDWVDKYSSLEDVVAWDFSKVRTNWFSAVSTGETYDAKINNSRTATINSTERYYMDPATSTANMFSGRTDLTSVDITGDHFNTASVTTTSNMFNGCTGLTEINLGGWNTQSLQNVSSMCSGAENLKTLTLNGWDFSKVIETADYSNFVNGCSSLTTLNLEGATIKHRLCSYYTSDLFYGAGNITTINAKNCKLAMPNLDNVFYQLNKLTNLDVSGWNTSEMTSMHGAFAECSSLETLNLSNWDVSNVSVMNSLFAGMRKLKNLNISDWQTSSLIDATSMFRSCVSLTGEMDLSSWNTEKLLYVTTMFSFTGIETLTLNGWDFSSITSARSQEFVNGSSKLTTVNLERATISHKLATLLSGATNITTINAKDCNLAITDLSNMFKDMSNLTNLDISGWDTSEVTSLAYAFNGCTKLENICSSTRDTNVNSNSSGQNNLKTANISDLHTSNLKYANRMFYGCSSLTGEMDLSSWDTGKLEKIEGMFAGTGIETLTLNGWNFSKTDNFANFTYGCNNLITVNLERATLKWRLGQLFRNATNLTTINAKDCNLALTAIDNEFSDLKNLIQLDISGWDISRVTLVSDMFKNCNSLQRVDLTGWVIPSTLDTSSMLSGCNRSTCTIVCSATTQAKLQTDNPNLVVNWEIR